MAASSVTVGILVRLEANSDCVNEVEQLLRDGLRFVVDEPATIAWFATRLGPTTFGIFDVFPDNAGRSAHLAGQLAAALTSRAAQLLARPLSIEPLDVLAAKLPS